MNYIKNRQKSATTTWIDGLTHDSFPSSLWIPKSTITRDHQSSTLHWNLLFQQCVENTLHVVGQIPLAKSFLVLSLVTCWRTFDQNVLLANLFVCSRVARLWPDCSLWDPRNQQRQWMSEGTGSFKIALREQSARFVSKKINCSLGLLTSSTKSIYFRSTKWWFVYLYTKFSTVSIPIFHSMALALLPSCVPSIKIFVFFLKPEVPGFCPSIGFVGMVSTAKSPWSFTIPGKAAQAREARYPKANPANPLLRVSVMGKQQSPVKVETTFKF